MIKRSFSLLEVIISCSIIAVITLFAISQLKGFVTLENQIQKESHHALDLSYFNLKTKLVLEENYLSDLHYEEGSSPSLSFSFKVPLVSDPFLPEKMWASLRFDQGALKISYYPPLSSAELPPPLREETFLEDVGSVRWKFLRYNESSHKFDPIKEWDQTCESKPHIAQVEITFKKEKKIHLLTFFLPSFHKIEFVI